MGFLMLGFICMFRLGGLCLCAYVWVFVEGFDIFGFGLFGVFLLCRWVSFLIFKYFIPSTSK